MVKQFFDDVKSPRCDGVRHKRSLKSCVCDANAYWRAFSAIFVSRCPSLMLPSCVHNPNCSADIDATFAHKGRIGRL
jgi:hypothetical protein